MTILQADSELLNLSSYFWLGPLVVAALAAKAAWNRARNGERGHVVKLLLAVTGASFALCLCELGARLFRVSSDNFGFTLAGKRWRATYWKPLNGMGLRDKEWSDERFAGKRVVAVVGDSFIAGTGIDDNANRLPERLAAELGEGWEPVVIADQGWGPVRELEMLRAFPFSSNLTVLAYYINDIEDVFPECGYRGDTTIAAEPTFGGWYIYNSHLVNYLFWRWYRSAHGEVGQRYYANLRAAYSDPVCVEHLKSVIRGLAIEAHRRGQIIALLYPHLEDIGGTAPLLAVPREVYGNMGIPVVDVSSVVNGRRREELVANSLDPHPSKRLQAELAQRIAGLVRELPPN